MNQRLFATAQTLVYDPVASNRTATRASLNSIGFRNVRSAGTLDLLENHLRTRSPDLLVAEVAGAVGELCNLIRSIRHGTLGRNPFLVVVVTTWCRDSVVVRQVVDSGADDLIARPLSNVILGERIRSLVERRKNFAITSDYIGPDRRHDPNRQGKECIEVPNSLQMRGLDGLSNDECEQQIAESIEQARLVIGRERMRCCAAQLSAQWHTLQGREPGTREHLACLVAIQRLAEDIMRRAVEADMAVASEWCQSIVESVQSISSIAERFAKGGAVDAPPLGPPMKLLGHAVATLGQVLAPGEMAQPQLVDLDSAFVRPAA